MQRSASRTLSSLLTFITFIALTGCGSGGGGTSEKNPEALRILNAAPHENVVLAEFGLADEQPQTAFVEYASATEYTDVSEGSLLMRIKRDEDVLPSVSATLTIASGLNYTYVVTEGTNTSGDRILEGTLIPDGQKEPNGGQFKIRVLNPVVATTAIDFYMSLADEGLNDASKISTNVKIKTASDYVDISPGEYILRITETGATKQLFKSDPIVFQEGGLYTVVLLEDAGGGKPYHALLIQDRF